MTLTAKKSKHNFKAFLWHAAFLAFAQTFIDVDTIIPAMVIESGGGAFHVGLVSAIMLGGASFTQLFFAPFLSNLKYKKKYLLSGINTRIMSLLALSWLIYQSIYQEGSYILPLIIFLITIFSISGAFTNISYVDILGKSVFSEKRKSFLSARQLIAGIIILFTAGLSKKVLSIYDFPQNYSMMFLIGGSSLLIASLGFWSIREPVSFPGNIRGIRSFINSLRDEWKRNPKLKYYLGFINTQGIVVSVIPFVILYAKENLATQSSHTGLYLLFKIIGMVSVSFIVLLMNKKIKYHSILLMNVFFSLLLSFTTIFASDPMDLIWVFVVGGFSVSLYMISQNGVLLEISGNDNRSLYVGFAGAGNLIPMIFPVISSIIISRIGFNYFFILYAVIILCSLFFIRKLKCKS